jgi:hypothetical protein
VTVFTLSLLLMLYTWFALAALTLVLMLIARFFGRSFGVETHYRLFLVPLAGFGVAAVRYTSIDQIAGDMLADVVLAAAGLMLIVMSVRLYRQMTAHKRAAE